MIPDFVLQFIGKYIPNVQQFQNINSPDELAQRLLESGKINQSQVNQAKQMWNQPNIRQMIHNNFKF